MPCRFYPGVVVFLILVAASPAISARSFRMAQLPNGFELGCISCHEGFGGGPRNAFGLDVDRTLVDGDVDWQAICDLDSDGDGYTNGQELGAGCDWTEGEPVPDGDVPSNPGESDSFPAPDLGVTIEASEESVATGGSLSYTVAVFNLGSRAAAEVRIELLLPEGMMGDIPGDECGVNPGGVSCFLIEDLQPNFGSNLFFPVQVIPNAAPGTYVVVARVSSSTEETDDDNNTASIEVVVTGSTSRTAFRRGDANDDGQLGISDSLSLFGALFLGGALPVCREAGDANNDGSIDITDGIFVLSYLFLGGQAPPAPGAQACGTDSDAEGSPGDQGCEVYTSCG